MVVEELLKKINDMLERGDITLRSDVQVNALFGCRSYDIEAYKTEIQDEWLISDRELKDGKIKSSLIIDTLL